MFMNSLLRNYLSSPYSARLCRSSSSTAVLFGKPRLGRLSFSTVSRQLAEGPIQEPRIVADEATAEGGKAKEVAASVVEKRWFDRIPGSIEGSGPHEMKWWIDKIVICVVFAIAGSSTMYFVRPLLSDVLGLTGSMIDGPWSYRFAYFFLITPTYTVILMATGALFGKYQFFLNSVKKIYSRFLPQSLQDKLFNTK